MEQHQCLSFTGAFDVLMPRFPTLNTLRMKILQIFTQLVALQIHFTSSPEICLRLEGAVDADVLFIASSQKSK